MRHLLEYLLLTLLPNFGFCLSLASQDCVKAPRANGCSDELLPVTSVPLQDLEQVRSNVVAATVCTSSQVGLPSSSRQTLPPHPLLRDSIASPANDSSKSNDGYRAAAYYVNWATYGRNYQPYDLPVEKLTHVFYAFANISSEDGKVSLSDPQADTDKHFASDPWTDPNTDLNGCLKQLFLLKKKNQKLKTLLSIGGSTYSNNIGSVLSTENGRQNFAQTAVALLADLGFDGLDIDWEYPENDVDAQSYVSLLCTVRAELDNLASKLPQRSRFLLTVASSCGPLHYKQMRLNEMDRYVDFWNLMAYDFTGSWTTVAGHQTNIFPSKNNTASTPFDAEAAVDHYTGSAGIPSQKIVLGMPLYGRIFAQTAGPGFPFVGVGDAYDWEAGVWDYKSLPRPGAVEYCDQEAVACWSYDSVNRLMVTYDTPYSVSAKVDYIKQRNLGGAMWWESSGDRTDEKSIINSVVDKFKLAGDDQMDSLDNVLQYPTSRYENLRNGFPNE
ncbi:glycoside hydrolase [Aureobasidium pullulans]|uniref:chitinase n=1 Tax=Aureobasidium pullulans TaxID=5580 RepID=A0A4T0B744_AURPU|nr:glycoside hydrolase [Aureobasidium pullulans]